MYGRPDQDSPRSRLQQKLAGTEEDGQMEKYQEKLGAELKESQDNQQQKRRKTKRAWDLSRNEKGEMQNK